MFSRTVLILILTDISDQVEASYLKAMSKRTSTMIASMTHELRTPLNGVIGLLDVADGRNINNSQGIFVAS